jgi:hypothetical protein
MTFKPRLALLALLLIAIAPSITCVADEPKPPLRFDYRGRVGNPSYLLMYRVSASSPYLAAVVPFPGGRSTEGLFRKK